MKDVTRPTEVSVDAALLNENWRRHKFLESLYEFYLEEILSFHSFYLPIAGGVVAYVLTREGSPAALALLIPLVISSGAVGIFYFSIREATELNNAIHESARRLDIISTHAQLLVRTVLAFLFYMLLLLLDYYWD
jgi:hypothetical protein